jgi:glycine cleavage system H lipoate-binding protein
VDGEVVEVNLILTTPDPKTKMVNLDILSEDPYGAAWLVKIRVQGGHSDLLDYAAYKKQCDESEG